MFAVFKIELIKSINVLVERDFQYSQLQTFHYCLRVDSTLDNQYFTHLKEGKFGNEALASDASSSWLACRHLTT